MLQYLPAVRCQKNKNTLPVKSFRSVRFFLFLNEVSSAHQGCFIW